jgi:hypothetical protein
MRSGSLLPRKPGSLWMEPWAVGVGAVLLQSSVQGRCSEDRLQGRGVEVRESMRRCHSIQRKKCQRLGQVW